MNLPKVLCCMVLFSFLTLTVHKEHNSYYYYLLLTEELTNRNVFLRNSCIVYVCRAS